LVGALRSQVRFAKASTCSMLPDTMITSPWWRGDREQHEGGADDESDTE